MNLTVDDTPIFQHHDVVFMPDGSVLQTHPESACHDMYCSIHNPSNHPLRDAPQLWHDRSKSIQRICSHGYRHHDPDDFMHKWRSGLPLAVLALIARHDCDGCCR